MFSNLKYDESSPTNLKWIRGHGKRKAGDQAGHKHNQGYFLVGIKGKRYLTHRVIWEMHNGAIPVGFEIDHIDRDRSNSKISNLRLVTRTQNNGNQSKQEGTSSQYKGVCKMRNGKWQAYIKKNSKKIHLGTFQTEELAAEVYKKEALVYFNGIIGG